MEKIDLWWTLILFTAVSISMTLIFISTVISYYKRKQELQDEKFQAIEKSEKEYRTLVDSMEDAVFVVNKLNQVILWNHRFCSCFGIHKEVRKGIELNQLFPEDVYNKINRYLSKFTGNTKPKLVELNFECDGNNKWFDISFIPQLNEDKKTISILCIAHDFTKRRNLQIQLEDMVSTLKSQQALLKDLSSEMIRAQEEERKSMSRDLHDEIGQTLTAISINLEILNQAVSLSELDISQRILDSKKLVIKTIQDIQRFSHDLRPALLDDLGLESAIQSHARKFSDRTGIKVDVAKSQNYQKLTNDVEIVLYRIFQEGLNNIAKHAQAKNIMVELETRENTIALSISDDGVGFNIKSLENKAVGKGGLGIKGMRERVKLIGGKLSLTSKERQGTTIYIEAPIGEA